jgi:ABC-type glycerol-3-phosphate transport system permease component
VEVVRPTAAAPPRRTAATHWGDLLWEILKYSLVAVVLFALLLPIYWIFASSLKLERDFFVSPPAFIFEPTLGNYTSALADLQFLGYLKNSLVVSISTTLATLTIGSLAAHALARYEFPGAKIIAIAILSARLVPGATMIMPYYVLFRFYGLNNTIPWRSRATSRMRPGSTAAPTSRCSGGSCCR